MLISYFYYRNQSLNNLIERIGYQPEILLDSGAYSAFTNGRGIALTDYMRYVKENRGIISEYISLDVIGDNDLSYWYYKIMKQKGYGPMPVVHFGQGDTDYLKKYINLGAQCIALGGTVPIHNKWDVSAWCRLLIWQYPTCLDPVAGKS